MSKITPWDHEVSYEPIKANSQDQMLTPNSIPNQSAAHHLPHYQDQNQKPRSLRSMKTFQLVGSQLDVNDDSMVDLNYEKNLTKIDYAQMQESMKESHASKTSGDSYECKDVCYKFDSGNHHIITSSEKSDLTKFGVGMILYFRFLKHLAIFFAAFTVLSIPAYILYIAFFAENSSEASSPSYLDLLTATTLGSVGMGTTSCAVARYPSTGVSVDWTTMYFQCPSGVIDEVSQIKFGLVTGGSTCVYFEERDLDTTCNVYDETDMETAFTDCVGNSECEITAPTTLFSSDTDCSDKYTNGMNVYIQVKCIPDLVVVAGQNVSKQTMSYVLTACDAAVTILFLFMIYTLKYAQKSATENVLKKVYSASSYTIQIHNLPQDIPSESLASKLWAMLDAKLGNNDGNGADKVVDVQIVLPNKLIELNRKVGDTINKKNTKIRVFIQLYAPDFEGTDIDLNRVHQIMLRLKESNHPQKREAAVLYKKIKDLAAYKLKLLAEIKRLRTNHKTRIVCAFVTFNTTTARNRILDMFGSTPFHRAMRYLFGSCYPKRNLFFGKLLRVIAADDPGSILWENLGEPKLNIWARRGFSAFVTLLLWAFTAGILLVSTYFKNEFKNKYPPIDCTNLDPTQDEAGTDYGLGEYQQGLIQCYCADDLLSKLNEEFSTAGDQKLCYIYFQNKVTSEAITFLIIFIVLVINYCVQFVFQILSKFEKHPTLNQELAQRVIKTFVAQFLNTGLIILLINAKISVDSSFWQGKFRDITYLWYENVGSTLLSTMFINVFTVPAVKIALRICDKIYQCCDRRCTMDRRVTRQKTQKAYEKVYLGPEFLIDARYSQLLTLVFVCFMYSGGMPFLYITSFAQVVLTYFIDKYFLLKVCKIPKNYDQKLEKVVRTTMYVAVVIHLIFAIFMFGQPNILENTGSVSAVSNTVSSISTNIQSNSEDVVSKFFTRITLDHNIILFILLIIVLALYVLKGIIYNFFKEAILGACRKDHDFARKSSKMKIGKRHVEIGDSLSFFRVLQSEDIASMIRLTKVTIKTTQNEDLIKCLRVKLELLKQEYAAQLEAEKMKQVDPNLNFIGFFTYDVRLNPTYKAQFAMDELLDDEDLS